ncbi:hypothetical protein BpHYR1_018793, partial [Brachionus plicatilis]
FEYYKIGYTIFKKHIKGKLQRYRKRLKRPFCSSFGDNLKSRRTLKEALRIRVYAFFNENRSLEKIFTVRHFMAEKIPRSTVYRI